MNIRKIIKEELNKVFSENYPAGAEYDSNAPWNQVDNYKDGKKSKKIVFNLIWTNNNEFAFFSDPNKNIYVFYVDTVDKDDFKPYVNREEHFEGYDEDGDPIIDYNYGDFEINGEVIENYLNDNLESMKIGKGLDDYESGNYNIVMLDDELRDDLLATSKYIKNEKERNNFIKVVSGQSI